MKIRCLTYNEILDIYREHSAKFGTFQAIRDNNNLLSVIANPQRQFAGKDLYPDIPSKAGILVFSMIQNHPFVDGNKRAAFISGRVFLRMNGYDVNSLENYYKIIVKIGSGKVNKDDLIEWLKISMISLDKIKKTKKGKSKKGTVKRGSTFSRE